MQPIVFFDIAGPDDSALRSFYTDATFRKDPAEKRIYVGVPDVAASLTQIEKSGGSIDVPRFEVPGVVVLGLFRDPAGNPMGLVEMDGDRPRIP